MWNRLKAMAESERWRTSLFACACVVILMGPARICFAHSVHVFAWTEGENVVVDGYFHDGTKCRDCTIEVLDPQGRKTAEGKTDAEGRFSFEPDVKTDLLIRLNDSMGHRAEYRFPAEDLPANLPGSADESGEGTEHTHAHPHPEPAEAEIAGSSAGKMHNLADIEQLVEDAVNRQLAPIRRDFHQCLHRRELSDIIGGIGYIIGLAGLLMYFRSKIQKGKQ